MRNSRQTAQGRGPAETICTAAGASALRRAAAATVRLQGFTFTLQGKSSNVRLITEFELKDGQKIIVGKANDGTDRSLILVVSAGTAL